jgi:hypothetical protein
VSTDIVRITVEERPFRARKLSESMRALAPAFFGTEIAFFGTEIAFFRSLRHIDY